MYNPLSPIAPQFGDQIKLTRDEKYIGVDLYLHCCLEVSNKSWTIAHMKVTLSVVGNLNPNYLNLKLLPTFQYGVEVWREDLKECYW